MTSDSTPPASSDAQPAEKKISPPQRSNGQNTDTPSRTLISIADLNAWYGDFQALHSLSLDIPEHKVTAFIGPSGCGKSTLLKWINRMNDIVPGAHAKGEMVLHESGGKDVDVLSPNLDVVGLRRQIGIVFQKPNPFPKSIYDNVAFGPRLHMKI